MLAKQEEVDAYHRAMLGGEDVSGWQFDGEITEPHTGFRKWVGENMERMEGAKSVPYWVKDNPKYVKETSITRAPLSGQDDVVTFKSDKERFRRLQDETRKAILSADDIRIDSGNIYTGHLYLGDRGKRDIVGHSFDSEELASASRISDILSNISNGKYLPIDMSRKNYKDKIEHGVMHFTEYEVNVGGVLYELKCEAIRRESRKNGRIIVEYPYWFRKKKKG